MGQDVTPPVATALAAAAIPLSKVGSGRHERLSDTERELYFWILRRFASTGRPSAAETRVAAESLVLDMAEPSRCSHARTSSTRAPMERSLSLIRSRVVPRITSFASRVATTRTRCVRSTPWG